MKKKKERKEIYCVCVCVGQFPPPQSASDSSGKKGAVPACDTEPDVFACTCGHIGFD